MIVFSLLLHHRRHIKAPPMARGHHGAYPQFTTLGFLGINPLHSQCSIKLLFQSRLWWLKPEVLLCFLTVEIENICIWNIIWKVDIYKGLIKLENLSLVLHVFLKAIDIVISPFGKSLTVYLFASALLRLKNYTSYLRYFCYFSFRFENDSWSYTNRISCRVYVLLLWWPGKLSEIQWCSLLSRGYPDWQTNTTGT